MVPEKSENTSTATWPSAVPQKRWSGFRRDCPGLEAFASLDQFKIAQQSELLHSLAQHERATLGRLLKRGQKMELDLFNRTHGANPIFDPQGAIDFSVGVAKADTVELSRPPSQEAVEAILDGRVVHVLFHAGEASRFEKGPFYQLNPTRLARNLRDKHPSFAPLLERIQALAANLPQKVAEFLVNGQLGPKQSLMIRASVRRLLSSLVTSKRMSPREAQSRFEQDLKNQKILYFMSQQKRLGEHHDQTLREEHQFYGFHPAHVLTIEQQLVPGVRLDEDGNIFLMDDPWAQDAAGHLYALIQAARPGDFTTYTESGRPIKPMEFDAFGYLSSRGGIYLNVVRINDMDRHTTEIINPKSLSYALAKFKEGYVNIIEGVSNPGGQKGGTGLTFGDAEIHILTETHENSFPTLSRAFEGALKTYLAENNGRHPAYNAMRQWALIAETRQVIKEHGGRVVFVPRHKVLDNEHLWYIGADMPMGDLSLLGSAYKSRMFQFIGPNGKELLIHDMKEIEQLDLHLQTVLHQLEDPHILAAAREVLMGEKPPIEPDEREPAAYAAPAPEFN